MIIFWTPYRYEDENRGEWNMMNNRVTRIIANSVGLAAVAALGITVYQLGTSPIKEEAPREQTESTDQEEQKQALALTGWNAMREERTLTGELDQQKQSRVTS